MAIQNIDVAKEASVQSALSKATEAATDAAANKTTLATVNTNASTAATKAPAAATDAAAIKSAINNSTYGLSALKTATQGVAYSSFKTGKAGTTANAPTTISGKGRIVLWNTASTTIKVKLNGASAFTTINVREDTPFELFFNSAISVYADGSGVAYYVAQLI